MRFPMDVVLIFAISIASCQSSTKKNEPIAMERQLTNSPKTHALDNNDNFSPDGAYLCYDTRYMVFNTNLANCKSIEKVGISTGVETVLWEPESVSGENAAPGVAAVSYHPSQNKVVFIHGPQLEEVKTRGYYDIRNRNGAMVDGDGGGNLTVLDFRDVAIDRPTVPGAHRGGTHRHEFSKNGQRIGFTYDDYLLPEYGRTIGYMERHPEAPKGYEYYFSVLLRPVKSGTSKPGEIERAYGDSWIDSLGTKRAFIGKVRAENGIDYENSLFVAEIPESTDITTAFSGDVNTYPTPPKGVTIRRLTHSIHDEGIVRGSYDGRRIAYLSVDSKGVLQVFVIPVEGSDTSEDTVMRPKQVTHFDSNAGYVRWHPSNDWLFSISRGKVYASYVGDLSVFGKSILLTPDNLQREALVVSPDGKLLAYNVGVEDLTTSRTIDGHKEHEYLQIFTLSIEGLLEP
ncbi:DUF3748 domain-containing protein [Pareuzebyella sediminis]|uniref:DUF3748 domain-containing protein n=1 Tax=Pareuzebyella sediminis TaxID=2607998 RepID=UPI0018E1D7CD|nr:DUF3748 domain-containing protein [Pareuzebyella sediminis]